VRFILYCLCLLANIANKQGKTLFLASTKVKVICASLPLRIAFLLLNRATRTCRELFDFDW